MRPHSPATRVAFRRAVWASVAIHVVAAGALVALLRDGEQKTREVATDTRVPHVQMHLVEDVVNVEVVPQPAPANTAVAKPKPDTPPTPVAVPPPVAVPSLPAGPFASAPPRTLPPELVALIRKPGASGTPAPVYNPNVRPATANAVPAMHGALKPGLTVVYVLDSSGSMGAAGKFDAARAALVATLRTQPATVRFQVIVYDGTARALLASDGTAPPATEANVREAAAKLAALEARGKSNHLVAVRAALGFRPDVVVLLTDADDLTAAALKPVLASGPKPVPVRVGVVTAAGVQQLRELK